MTFRAYLIALLLFSSAADSDGWTWLALTAAFIWTIVALLETGRWLWRRGAA